MARVIATPVGDLYTSKANAHAIGRGDRVCIGTDSAGYEVLDVVDNRQTSRPGVLWLDFGLFGMEFDTNQPIDRVVGANSTGTAR